MPGGLLPPPSVLKSRGCPLMPLLIRCPNNHRLSVPSRRAGQVVTCPQCGASTKVPGPEVVAAAKAGLQGDVVRGAANGGGKQVEPAAPPPVPGRKKSPPVRAAGNQDSPRDTPENAQTAGASPVTPAATPAARPVSPDRPGQRGSARSESKTTKPPPLPGRARLPLAVSKKARPPRTAVTGKRAAEGPAAEPAGDQPVSRPAGSPGDIVGKAAAGAEPSRSTTDTRAPAGGPAKPSAKEVADRKTRWREAPEYGDELPAAADGSVPGSDSSLADAADSSGQPEPPAAETNRTGRVPKCPAASDGDRRPDSPSSDAGVESVTSRGRPIDLLADTAELALPREAAHAPSLADDVSPAAVASPAAPEPATVAQTPPTAAPETSATEVLDAVASDLVLAGNSRPPEPADEVATPPPMTRPVPTTVPAPPAEEPPVAAADGLQEEPEPAPVGIRHSRENLYIVYCVAAGMVLVAAVSMVPAIREIGLHFLAEAPPGIGPWTPFVLLLSFVQLAYVVYVVQLPDWGSTRVMMVLAVVIAMIYAAGLGFTVMTDNHSELILSLGYSRQQMIAWCLLILLLMCSLAYAWARVTFRWQRNYRRTALGRGYGTANQ